MKPKIGDWIKIKGKWFFNFRTTEEDGYGKKFYKLPTNNKYYPFVFFYQSWISYCGEWGKVVQINGDIIWISVSIGGWGKETILVTEECIDQVYQSKLSFNIKCYV